MNPLMTIAISVGLSKLLDTKQGREITHRVLSHLNEETKKIFTSAIEPKKEVEEENAPSS